MNRFIEKLVLVVALCVPVGVLTTGVPALFDLADSTEPREAQQVVGTSLPLPDTDSTVTGRRFASVNPAPPPTLSSPTTPTPETPATPAVASTSNQAAPTATPGGPRVAIFNTGGIGAVVRDSPSRDARRVTGLRDGQTALELGRHSVDGADWIQVRTDDGAEGWILGIVGQPANAAPVAQPGATPTGSPLTVTPTLRPRTTGTPTNQAGVRMRVAGTDGRGVVLHTAPSTAARVPAGFLEGAGVTLLEQNGEWAHVRGDNGLEGWVPAQYLALSE